MNRKFKITLAISALIHATVFAGVVWLSLDSALSIGGGEGIVEVGIVSDGAGSSSVRPERVEGRTFRASTGSARTENEQSDGFVDGNSGGSGGGDGGTGFGVGDPRLTQIWKRINRAKYYPEMARRQGVEGAPKVAFSISEDGKVGGVKVVESSGNEILDKAAVEAIQNSAPLPFYPQPITIAVRYSLKER